MAAMRGEPADRPPLWLREGFDLLDPIPPADDFRNGWRAEPAHIKARVREILADSQVRTVVGASAGPMSKVSRRIVENYRALVEAIQEMA